MGIWSSILEFCRKWKPELRLYGIGGLLFVCALLTGRFAAGLIVLLGTLAMDAMRRWGEPWRQLGERENERRKQERQQWWEERVASFFQSSSPREPAASAPPPTSASETVADGLPESPELMVAPPAQPVSKPPAVTHET